MMKLHGVSPPLIPDRPTYAALRPSRPNALDPPSRRIE
ncbi:unnamed protein product [Ciceribacter selenitireducens ATCC BAA-1503]|uniref:Uncharacterized protein n=1 Tax=Ciceribacter selenitireducens ATCC BAA-1503 TaxID=1336235 RepID=A0A376AEG2_9HYPH|nr:unnamed protein product [Ciceribacter selenitireducens ATCC BAA-1503]